MGAQYGIGYAEQDWVHQHVVAEGLRPHCQPGEALGVGTPKLLYASI